MVNSSKGKRHLKFTKDQSIPSGCHSYCEPGRWRSRGPELLKAWGCNWATFPPGFINKRPDMSWSVFGRRADDLSSLNITCLGNCRTGGQGLIPGYCVIRHAHTHTHTHTHTHRSVMFMKMIDDC